jgi:integrase/recombinase XerD
MVFVSNLNALEQNNIGSFKGAQIWFRGPKIWDDFLKEKAAKEYCSKSDLLRRAFRLAYDDELKEFRTSLKSITYSTLSEGEDNKGEASSIQSDILTMVPYGNVAEDPWIESMAAFVANKRSPQTRRVYSLMLKQFCAFTPKHPSIINQSDVIRYRHHLEQLARAASTIRLHLSAISGYYSFCISRDLTIHNPVKGVNQPSIKSYTTATWLNKEQSKTLLSQPNRNTVKGKRDYAIILTFLLTGLRRKEMASIRIRDIQKKGGKLYLNYICKGGTRIVRDIPQICGESIEDYLKASGRDYDDDFPLFLPVTNAGNNLKRYYRKNAHDNETHSLTPEAIRQMIAGYSNLAFGGKIKVRPHTLRHTAGTLLRKSGRTIEEVQSFLKHKRIDTTRRYLHTVESNDSELGECIANLLEL